MTRLDQGSGRLSLRNSILVWVAGIVIGWGCAVVLFYQLIRDSSEDRGVNAPGLMAGVEETVGVVDIAPAAGQAATEAPAQAAPQNGPPQGQAQGQSQERGQAQAEATAEKQLH